MRKKLILYRKKLYDIYDEIKANGYNEKISLFKSTLKGIRQEARTNIKKIRGCPVIMAPSLQVLNFSFLHLFSPTKMVCRFL